MAITLRHPKPVTDEELLEFSRLNPGYQFERDARGELIVTPPGDQSAYREGRLFAQLDRWAENNGSGLVFPGTAGFRFPDGSVYAPDASWVPHDRWGAISKEQRLRFAPLCPEAVFEIRSESQSPAELREKMRVYMINGAGLGVLIDPERRTVEVYRRGREPEMHMNPGTVALDPELPGFALELGPLFAA